MTLADSVSPEQVRRELGGILRGSRERAGRTLTDVASEAGCSPAYLSEVERGRKDISTDLLIGIAYALAVPAGTLYSELGRRLSPEATGAPTWSGDPRQQLRLATSGLDGESLRTVAMFSSFLAMNRLEPRRRIGFVPPTSGSR